MRPIRAHLSPLRRRQDVGKPGRPRAMRLSLVPGDIRDSKTFSHVSDIFLATTCTSVRL